MKKNCFLILQVLLFNQFVLGEESWTGEVDSNWSTAGNWVKTLSDEKENHINFNRSSAQTNIKLEEGHYQLASLTFDAMTSYTISGGAGSGLVFNRASSNAEISALQGEHYIDVPLISNADTTIYLSREAVLGFGPNSSMFTPNTLVIQGEGDLVNTSIIGVSPNTLILKGGTITNREHAVLAEKANLLLISGGTLINGDVSASESAEAGKGAKLIEVTGGTVVNERSRFGTGAAHFKMSGGTVLNRGDSYFCSKASLFEMFGGTAINDGSHLGFHEEGASGAIIVHKGTLINQNKAVLGSHFTYITLNDGIIINSKDSQVFSANFHMSGGTVINDGTISIIEYDSFFEMGGGVVTGTGSFVAGTVDRAFTFRNADTVIPGTIASNTAATNELSSSAVVENYRASGAEGQANFVRDVIEANGYGSLETPHLQFIPGTLALSGGGVYEQTADGTLIINVIDTQSYSQLKAASAELNGVLQINGLSHFDVQPGEPLKILDAPNGVSGSFSRVEGINLPSLVPLVSYLSDGVEVSFSPTLHSYIGGLSQTMFASVNHLNIRLDRQMERLRNRFASTSEPLPVQTQSSLSFLSFLLADNDEQRIMRAPIHEKHDDHPWSVYLGPLGSLGKVNSSEHQVGLDYWSAGVLAGFDYAWTTVGLGFSWEYERIDSTAEENWGRFTIDHTQASLYATYAPPRMPEFALNGIVGGGCEWYHIDRHAGTFTVKKVAQGTPFGGEFDALAGAQYTFSEDKFAWMPQNLELAPMANLQYIYLAIDGYKEHTGQLFNLKIGSQTAQSLRSLLGAKLNYRWDWTNFTFSSQVDLGWQREYLDKERSVFFSPLNILGPGSSISVVGAGRNTGLAGVDFLFSWNRKFDIDASYDFEWNSLFQDHFFYLGFTMHY